MLKSHIGTGRTFCLFLYISVTFGYFSYSATHTHKVRPNILIRITEKYNELLLFCIDLHFDIWRRVWRLPRKFINGMPLNVLYTLLKYDYTAYFSSDTCHSLCRRVFASSPCVCVCMCLRWWFVFFFSRFLFVQHLDGTKTINRKKNTMQFKDCAKFVARVKWKLWKENVNYKWRKMKIKLNSMFELRQHIQCRYAHTSSSSLIFHFSIIFLLKEKLNFHIENDCNFYCISLDFMYSSTYFWK